MHLCGIVSVRLKKVIHELNDTFYMMTELNPDALSIAADYDSQHAAGNVTGPLYGISILIKNNTANHDLTDDTAGSFRLLGSKVPPDPTMALSPPTSPPATSLASAAPARRPQQRHRPLRQYNALCPRPLPASERMLTVLEVAGATTIDTPFTGLSEYLASSQDHCLRRRFSHRFEETPR